MTTLTKTTKAQLDLSTKLLDLNESDASSADLLRTIGSNVSVAGKTVYGTFSNEVLKGGAGDDTVYTGGGQDTVYTYGGNDLINADSFSSTTIYAGDGQDLIITDSTSNIIASAGAGNDVVFGGNYQDIINGDGGSDILFGGTGNDILSGGNGNDVLSGDYGNDVLNGGAGQDIFVFGNGGNWSTDLVQDFQVGLDVVQTNGASINYFGNDGVNTYLDLSSGEYIIFQNAILSYSDII